MNFSQTLSTGMLVLFLFACSSIKKITDNGVHGTSWELEYISGSERL